MNIHCLASLISQRICLYLNLRSPFHSCLCLLQMESCGNDVILGHKSRSALSLKQKEVEFTSSFQLSNQLKKIKLALNSVMENERCNNLWFVCLKWFYIKGLLCVFILPGVRFHWRSVICSIHVIICRELMSDWFPSLLFRLCIWLKSGEECGAGREALRTEWMPPLICCLVYLSA